MPQKILRRSRTGSAIRGGAAFVFRGVPPIRLPFFAVITWSLLALPAWAHRVDASAHVHDGTIHGEAAFADGQPVADAIVTARDIAGHVLGETKTDAQGEFTFTPRVRVDHFFVVNAGGGHAARCVVLAGDLPSDLPPPADRDEEADRDRDAEPPAHDHGDSANHGDGETVDHPHTHGDASLGTLAQEIDALRRQVASLERTTRFRDVLGGIGFIFGIAGVAFYFLAKRR
ncbi:MAG: carboxypeptidase regulatory-like domain-containing protein [Pirellulales bacterium]|nr:carboxypeptidase regulatory-like domain-containing protein [Pirellulales bacterium]